MLLKYASNDVECIYICLEENLTLNLKSENYSIHGRTYGVDNFSC